MEHNGVWEGWKEILFMEFESWKGTLEIPESPLIKGRGPKKEGICVRPHIQGYIQGVAGPGLHHSCDIPLIEGLTLLSFHET